MRVCKVPGPYGGMAKIVAGGARSTMVALRTRMTVRTRERDRRKPTQAFGRREGAGLPGASFTRREAEPHDAARGGGRIHPGWPATHAYAPTAALFACFRALGVLPQAGGRGGGRFAVAHEGAVRICSTFPAATCTWKPFVVRCHCPTECGDAGGGVEILPWWGRR